MDLEKKRKGELILILGLLVKYRDYMIVNYRDCCVRRRGEADWSGRAFIKWEKNLNKGFV